MKIAIHLDIGASVKDTRLELSLGPPYVIMQLLGKSFENTRPCVAPVWFTSPIPWPASSKRSGSNPRPSLGDVSESDVSPIAAENSGAKGPYGTWVFSGATPLKKREDHQLSGPPGKMTHQPWFRRESKRHLPYRKRQRPGTCVLVGKLIMTLEAMSDWPKSTA